jgi:hypothetical protein
MRPRRGAALVVVLMLPLYGTALGGVQDEKHPVPDPAELKKQETEIRGIYKDEFSRKDRDNRRTLCQNLLNQAKDAGISPVQRFAILILARDVSAEALDVKTGLASIELLDRRFEIKPAPVAGAAFVVSLHQQKAAYLLAARKHASSPDDVALLAGAFMGLAESAMAVGEFEDAGVLADQAVKASKDPSFILKARLIQNEIAGAKGERDQATKAATTLAKNPEDPEANTALGRYLLFVKRDETGLAHLSKGAASPLRDAAAGELAKPATPEAMLELGDSWLAVSEKEKSAAAKSRLQERALNWLDRAFQSASGLTRVKIKKRLADLGQIEEPSSDQLLCRWFFDEGSGSVTLDSSPRARKATLMNGVKWVPGPSGTAVSFDGNGSYVACDTGGIQFANIPQTVAWAHHVPSVPKGTAFAIALTAEKTPLILGLGYRDGKVSVWKTTATILQAPAPPAGEWHYYAYTYDQKSHKLYVDGVLKGTSTESTMAGQYQMVELGRWYGGYPTAGGAPNQFFQGAVDDLRIYRRALDESEIRELVRKRKN